MQNNIAKSVVGGFVKSTPLISFHTIIDEDVSLILHIIISALLVLSLADLKTTSYIVDSNVYILCDVSTSTIKSREKMDEYIEEYKDKITSNTSLGVICYGKNQELLVPLGEEIKSVSLSSCDPSSSNLEEPSTGTRANCIFPSLSTI